MQTAALMEALRDLFLSPALPLHPAVVHIPLVLALAVPLVLAWLARRSYKGGATRRAWAMAVALQATILAGGLVALRTGESEEERVGATVGEWPLEMHERLATTFVIAAGALLAIVVAGMAAPRIGRLLAPVGLVASLAVATLGISTGHAGGALVYRQGAAQAPTSAPGQTEAGRADDD